MSQVKPVLNVANHWNIVPGNKPDFVVEVDSRSRLKNTLSDPSGATDLASQRNFSTSLNGWCAPPEVKLTLTFRITGNLNTGGQNPGYSVNKLRAAVQDALGLEQLPVNSLINNCQVETSTGINTTSNPSELAEYYKRTLSPDDLSKISYVVAPCSQQPVLLGTRNNILKWGDDSRVKYVNGSGREYSFSYSDITVNGGNNDTCDVTVVLRERLLARPFQYQSGKLMPAFSGLQVSLNFHSDTNALRRIIRVVQNPQNNLAVGDIQSVTAQMIFNTYQPPLQLEPSKMNKLSYDSFDIFHTNRTLNLNQDTGGDAQVSFSGIPANASHYKLEVLPLQYQNFQYPISSPITSINIATGDHASIFATLDSDDLFEISKSNCYNLPRVSFKQGLVGYAGNTAIYGNGSSLIFRPTDLGIGSSFVNNVAAPLKMDINITVGAVSDGAAVPLALHFYAVQDKILYYDDGVYREENPIFTDAQVLTAQTGFSLEKEEDNYLGGKSLVKQIKRGLDNVGNFMNNAKPYIKVARKVATPILYATNPELAPGVMVANEISDSLGAGKGKGGALVPVGGQRVSKKDLTKMLYKKL